MPSIYDLKPSFQQLLRPLAGGLHRGGVTANTVTLAVAVASVLSGAWMACASDAHLPFLLLPVFMLIRMALNAIGAHADIGGGFGKDENQLSQVALAWMVEQAKAAGLKMGDSPLLHTIIANPVVHDKSDNQYATTGWPTRPGIEDRTVRYRDGTTTTQMAMKGTGMTFMDTRQVIDYLPAAGLDVEGNIIREPRADFVTGTVDMQGYLDWLNKNGYNINMTVH